MIRGDPKLCFLSKCGPPETVDEEKKGSFDQDDSKLDFDDDRCVKLTRFRFSADLAKPNL